MNISFKRHLTDAVKHRYHTDLNVSSDALSGKIIDTVTPTYVADHNLVDNYQALTISPMNASLIGASSIPFNVLIRIADIDMKRLKKAMLAVKEKELTFVSVGYGGLSINMLHFMSLLSYRVGVEDIFSELHIYENDNVSYTNIMRIYKDLTHFSCGFESVMNKTLLFNEENLAKDILLHQYYLKSEHIGEVGNDIVFFGAPDFTTREMLSDKQFIFGGHTGDEVAFVYRPKVDADLTVETYGSINLASFYLNMMKATEELIYMLADRNEWEPDSIMFKYNAKKEIASKYNFDGGDFGKEIKSYEIDDKLSLII